MQIITQVFIVVALVLGYFFIDFSSLYNKIRGDGNLVVQDKECNLKESSCVVTIEDGTTLELEILQKDIPLMKPLDFRLKSSNPDLENLTLKIYATNMMMGIYELKFRNDGDGNYSTIGTLPTCTIGGMKWNADIEIAKSFKIIGARFQFQTEI